MRSIFIFALALLFSYLFYDANLGLNWFIFILAGILAIGVLNKGRFHRLALIGLGGALLSTFSVLMHPTGWTLLVNLLWIGFFVATMSAPQLKSAFSAVLQVFAQFLMVVVETIVGAFRSRWRFGKGLRKYLRYYYLIVPAMIILIFAVIYASANPWMADFLGIFGEQIERLLRWIRVHVDMTWLGLFVLGVVLSTYALTPAAWKQLMDWEAGKTDQQVRKRQPMEANASFMALKHEWRSVVFLLTGLNALLFILNLLDVWHVWIGFEWSGDYLKQFVHEGTWLLVLSIALSVAITLYYYRGNLSFLQSPLLRYLTVFWIAQNAFLALSVVRRNLYYIEYYNLAYKRIAVMFFLALVLFGLFTVLWKVLHRKSAFYLLRTNTLAVWVMFLVSASVSWDPIIARYNIAQADTAFVHYDFLARMSMEALPYVDLPLERLKEIEAQRNARFPEEDHYMTAAEFYELMQDRKEQYRAYLGERTWKDWSYSDHQIRAYLGRERDKD